MIKLFQSTDKLFSSNGDKVIISSRAKVHKEDNGSFYLDLETGLEYIDYLVEDAIIVAPTPQGEQAFRINNVQKTRKKITTKANHVFYDAQNYLIADSYVVDKNCNDALVHLNSATDTTSPFLVSSDVNTVTSFRCVRNSLYEAFQTVLERWGGHLVRDNFSVSIKTSIGQDNGVVIRYAKNLREITCSENWDAVCTKILPVGKDGILLPEVYLISSTQYDIPYTKTISFSQDINREDYPTESAYTQALINDLRTQAQKHLNENNVPKINYTLKANVEKITDIGDIVVVYDERLGLNLNTNVISYTYDCILDKYTEIEFGTFTPKLSNLVSNISSNVSATTNEQIQGLHITINQEIEEVNTALTNQIDNLETSLGAEITEKTERHIITANISSPITNLDVNRYTKIPIVVKDITGNKLSINNGGIKVGTGVSKIKISASVHFDNILTTGERKIRLIKNTNISSNLIEENEKTIQNNFKDSLILTSILGTVEDNDTIYLLYYTNESTDIIKNVIMTIEVTK